ncbi:MAG: DUF805 domain-containing protein [Patescibacteria group bacterium]
MQEYKTVLKKYAVFRGRASRREYWMFILFNIIATIIAAIVDVVLGTHKVSTSGGSSGGLVQSLYSLAVFIPSIAVGVRRLHDTSRSGWWMLLPFAGVIFLLVMFYNIALGAIVAIIAMLVGVIVTLVFYCLDSTPGDNKYGPNPKGMPAAVMAATPIPAAAPTEPMMPPQA